MTSASLPIARRRVLADLIPGAVARDVGLVLGLVVLTALAAQIRIPTSPVPITGTTFAVLLGAAALGPWRSAIAQTLYMAVGIAGLPVYQSGNAGWAYFAGATGGYIVGFIVASVVVGALARAGTDRRVVSAALAFVAGSLVIYLCGVPWLTYAAGLPLETALFEGMVKFLPGDALKAVAAGLLLPAAWRIAGRTDNERGDDLTS